MPIRIFVCLCIMLVTASCRKTDSPASTKGSQSPSVQDKAKNDWKEFISKEDCFVVSFPSKPETESRDNQYDFGKVTIRAYTTTGINPYMIWRVATHTYPEQYTNQKKPESLIEVMSDGMAKNVKGEAEGVKKISLDGYPGLEFLVHTSNPITKGPLTVKTRLFAVGCRVYQISVVASKFEKGLEKDVAKFFESFRLLKK